ncbi:S-layer protein domain-containing protein, partial [Methanohalophilus sp.]
LGCTIVPSPVFDEADNFDVWKTNSIWQINAMNYSGFYYDIHDDVYGETLTIYESNTMGQRTLGESSLVYETSIIDGIAPEFAFSLQGAPSTYFSYSILGFMGERYVPITNNVSTVSKLLIDDDDSYTLRVGESLELGEGYAVTPQQIDVDGAQVWLELTKDGEYVDDKVINIAYANTHDRTWYFDQNIGNKEDVTTLMIHVDEVFQGQVDSLCVIEGIWQISGNPMQFNIDDAHGLFTVTKCTETLQMELSDPLYLEKGKTYDILPSSEGDLAISVADSTSLRFNFVKEAYDDFQQQIRGSVVEVGSESETITWSTTGNNSFMGLWYDLDSVQTSEKITVKEINNYERVIEEGNLIYTSTKSPNIDPEFNFTDFTSTYDKFQYDVIGIEGKAYVPITEDNVSTMSKLLLDTSSSYTLRTGESLVLGEGYALTPNQIDVEGNKIWLELTKDGDFVDDKVISTDGTNSESKTWYFEHDIVGNDNVLTLMVHVDELFQGQVDSLCIIDGVWQISDSPIVIEEGNVFGNLVVSNQTNDVIEMKNEDEIYLDEDEIVDVFGGIKFNIADDPTSLRFCPTMTSSLSNNPPECFIDMIYPDPVLENTSIIFKGHATDFDGFIVGYRWESNIDGLLSNEKCFTDSSLSPGNHTISLKVQDEDGVWSNERLIKLSVFTESQAEENLSSVFDKADNFDVWNTDSSWYLNASDFDGFYRDEYDDLSGESFTVYENRTVDSLTLGEGSLFYETVMMSGIEPYFPFMYDEYTPFTYQKIALFGDVYVPIYGDSSTLSKLLIDDDKTYSVAIGESLELADGYAITPQEIDGDGSKVWLVLTKNGDFVDDKIIDTLDATTYGKTWYFEQDIGDADDVTTLMVHVDGLFQTQNNGTCIINGIWQISDQLLHLDVDDKFGKMEINSVSHDGIEMELDESVTLNASQTYSLAGNIGLKVADNEELLRFRFVKYNPSNISNTLPTSIIDSITPNPANESEIVTFQGSGVDIDGNIVDYYWNSSIDGQLSTSANFSTSSLSPGTHTIYFSVQDDDGAWSEPVSTTLTINEKPNVVPTATIDSITPNPANESETVSFTGSGTDSDGSIVGYNWTSSIDGHLNASSSFSTSDFSLGTHTIYFSVQDDDGAWSEPVSTTLTINEKPNVVPTATIDSINPNPANESETVTFTGSGTDSDGSIVGYNWTSSIDGHLNASSSFSTSDFSLGTHTIYFSVQDDDGAWSEPVSTTLTINEKPNVAPTATIGSIDSKPATEGDLVSFTGSGTDSDGNIVEYNWTSSIDGHLNSSSSFSTSDLSLGTHTITLSVQDDDGAWSEPVSTTLTINEKPNVAPTATIGSIDSKPATEGDLVSFTGSGTDS